MDNKYLEEYEGPILLPTEWRDYELLETGDSMKRERWGDFILIRPESQAFWTRQDPSAWTEWDACFNDRLPNGGDWEFSRPLPPSWTIGYRDLTFLIRPTATKHTGIFPEQAVNWDWCAKKIRASVTQGKPVHLLNLFGYSGGATVSAVAAGATVCHVDASKPMVEWCSENIRLSGLSTREKKAPIRYIVDDCLKFLHREIRRGRRYDAIILDPPTFGRGRSGEIWRIEDHLLTLLEACQKVISDDPLFILLNAYAAGLSSRLPEQMLQEIFGPGTGDSKEPMGVRLGLRGTLDNHLLPCGVTARWEA